MERPSRRAPYELFIAAGLAMATGLGLVLALLLTLSRWFHLGLEVDGSRLAETHGEVQLWGFLGLFITGMAFRLLDIFTRGRLPQARLAMPILVLVLAATLGSASLLLVASDTVQIWGGRVAAVALVLAATMFLQVVVAAWAGQNARRRRTFPSFGAGSSLLLLAAVLQLVRAFTDDSAAFYLRTAITLCFLGGFVIAFVTGVAARALRRRPWPEQPFMLVLALNCAFLAVALTWLEFASSTMTAARLADVALLCLSGLWLAAVWFSGIFDPAADQPGVSSRPHLILVRTGILWLVFAALWLGGAGIVGLSSGTLPAAKDFDAVRHALGLGMATTLIAGMSLLLLPPFAAQPLNGRRQRLLAISLTIVLNAAALLRVGGSLLFEPGTRLQSATQAVSGAFAELGLLVLVAALIQAIRQAKLGGRNTVSGR